MTAARATSLLPTLVASVLLLAGQAAAALHAFEHDAGPLPGKSCSTCVTASQLGAASVDCPSVESLEPGRTTFEAVTNTGFASADGLAPRSRGPPPGA